MNEDERRMASRRTDDWLRKLDTERLNRADGTRAVGFVCVIAIVYLISALFCFLYF